MMLLDLPTIVIFFFEQDTIPVGFHIDNNPTSFGGLLKRSSEFAAAFRVGIVGVFAIGVCVVDDQAKAGMWIVDGDVLKHRLIAIGITKSCNRATTNELVNANGFALLVIDKDRVEGFHQHRFSVAKFELYLTVRT